MKPQLVKPDPSSEDGLSVRLNKPAKRRSYTLPLLIAAAVHVVAIGAIVMSLNGKPKAALPALPLRTAPKTDVVTPPAAPVQAAPVPVPAESAAAPASEPVVEKPAVKAPAAKPEPPVKKASGKAVKTSKAVTAKKTAKPVKTAHGKTEKTKAAKARPAPKKKPAPQKKTSTLDLDALSKMGGKH